MIGATTSGPNRVTELLSRFANVFRGKPKMEAEPRSMAMTLGWPDANIGSIQAHAAAQREVGESWLPGFVQGAKEDVTASDRWELIRKSRYFEQTGDLANKILDLIETNVIGGGVIPTPSSSSPKYNAAALAYWNSWCQFADLTSRQSFYTLQAIIARAMAVDGEIFCYLARGETGFPRLMLIEAHRIVSVSRALDRLADPDTGQRLSAKDENGKPLFYERDGVIFDARGRPIYYLVSNDESGFSGATPRSFTAVPAARMVHFFEPSRTGQERGIPLFHAALHHFHNLDDLERFEMRASKDAASRTRTVYNETGEAPVDPGATSPIGRSKRVANAAGTVEDRTAYYRQAYGAETVYMKQGDRSVLDVPLRPTSAQMDFWIRLERRSCRAIGISYAAVCDYEGNWGGATLRAAVASDNRFYDVRASVLTAGWQRIKDYVMSFGNDVIRAEGIEIPADANKTIWQNPRRSTVDVGRESKATIEELDRGIQTERDVQGELGRDWIAVQDQRATEVRRKMEQARKLAKEFGVPFIVAFQLLAGSKTQLPQQPPPAAAPQSAGETNTDDTDPEETDGTPTS